MIGDPTGRSKTRPPLSREDIEQNAETYKTQIFRILDPARTIVRFNREWLEPLGSDGWIRLAAKYNIAQMMERRDFKQRYATGQPIAIHEFLYPLAQAYDSVFLEADVELGGSDQLFNLNVGRDIMAAFGLERQIVMTTPLLEGLDGVEKMSKSLGNYVGVTESPGEMFGKLMSVSDDLMWRYYLLLTDLSAAEVDALEAGVARGDVHPKHAKVDLAKRIVSDFHGAAAAEAAAEAFERRFARKEVPADLETIEWVLPDVPRAWTHLLVTLGLAESSSDAGRKIKQGAVKVDGTRLGSVFEIQQGLLQPGRSYVIEVGRRAIRLSIPER
jgi:tyrosyl-tRNA synthetase